MEYHKKNDKKKVFYLNKVQRHNNTALHSLL